MASPSRAGRADGARCGPSARDRSGALTVLIADSLTLFAQSLARTLARQSDMQVCDPQPQSGVHAAQAAVILRPSIAVVDLWLEGISGPETARSIVAKSPTTGVIVLGWLHSREHIRHTLDAGASGFVSKGSATGELVDAIRRVAAGERIVSDRHHTCCGDGAAGAPRPTRVGDERSALTPRELEVLRLLGAGLLNAEVADRLGIAEDTARRHIAAILAKTDAHSQAEAVAVARHRGALT